MVKTDPAHMEPLWKDKRIAELKHAGGLLQEALARQSDENIDLKAQLTRERALYKDVAQSWQLMYTEVCWYRKVVNRGVPWWHVLWPF